MATTSSALHLLLTIVTALAITIFVILWINSSIDWHQEFYKLGQLVGQFRAGMEAASEQ